MTRSKNTMVETGNKGEELRATESGRVSGPDPANIVEPDGRKPDRVQVSVDDVLKSDRKECVAKYRDQFPDHVLSFQRFSVSRDDLEAKFMEVVTNEHGEPVRVMGDVLTKQPREVYDRQRLLYDELSAQALEDVVDSDELRVVAEPRKPKKLKVGRT